MFAARLAAQAFSAGDVGQYEALIQAGTRANLAESYAEAEQAFRAALALQRKALGAADLLLTPEDLAAIEAAVPKGAAAGERYAAAQLAHLDSERHPVA